MAFRDIVSKLPWFGTKGNTQIYEMKYSVYYKQRRCDLL